MCLTDRMCLIIFCDVFVNCWLVELEVCLIDCSCLALFAQPLHFATPCEEKSKPRMVDWLISPWAERTNSTVWRWKHVEKINSFCFLDFIERIWSSSTYQGLHLWFWLILCTFGQTVLPISGQSRWPKGGNHWGIIEFLEKCSLSLVHRFIGESHMDADWKGKHLLCACT